MAGRKGPLPYRLAKRIVTGVIGGTLLLLGAIMLITPGPGILAIFLALVILAAEFAWARLWLRRLKEAVPKARQEAFRQGFARWRERIFGPSRDD